MNLRLVWLVGVAGCGMADRAAPEAAKSEPAPMDEEGTLGGAPGGSAVEQGAKARREAFDGDLAPVAAAPAAPPPPPEAPAPGSPALRAWFPEAFLWMPRVETGPTGVATVSVPVPDTLTTWRVLGLGWSATGATGGAETTFASTLPAYVDLVLPRALYAGDRVEVPVQVVNQSAEPLRAALEVRVRGATGAGGGAVAVGPYGAWTGRVGLVADRPGELEVEATLGEVDAVRRGATVRPAGRPVTVSRGGTLAAPRELSLDGLPDATAGELAVTVFPGALAIVGQELAVAPDRPGGVAEAAYLHALARRAAPLVQGGDVDAATTRAVELVALQRLARPLRAPEPAVACAALPGLAGAEADGLAGRLRARLVEQVASAQAADGLWTAAAGTDLPRALVESARCVYALGADGERERARAARAFARFADRLDRPAVAAWALLAGVLDAPAAEAARARVQDALEVAPDGSRRLGADPVAGVDALEASALAAALFADDPAVGSDLVAGLFARWTPARGFGSGTAGLLALDALARGMGGALPDAVTLRLVVDGVAAGEGALDPQHPRQPVTLRGPGLLGAGPHTVRVEADPPVPGLAFTLAATSWVPWRQAAPAGLDLRVGPPVDPRVGQRADVIVEVAGPVGLGVEVVVGLPAGVTVDEARLRERLGGAAATVEDGAVRLVGVGLEGGVYRLAVPVIPTLAGRLTPAPSEVRSGDGEAFVRVPEAWTVR